MRIATWNVNSIRTRVGRVLDYAVREGIDVLAMQEIKCKPEQFPLEQFRAAGYEVEVHGLNQWNGVAVASRLPMHDVATHFPGMPGFGNEIKGMEHLQGEGANGLPREARALGVTVDGVRLWSLYVPNGRSLTDPHMQYKLEWLAALRESVRQWLAADEGAPLALLGDWNVCPTPADCGDPAMREGESTHVSPAERAAFASFAEVGLADAVRPYAPTGYTYWDYKGGKYARGEGLRIDFILGSQAFTDAVVAAGIAADERGGEGPSDHVPVWCDIDPQLLFASDDEDGYGEFGDGFAPGWL